MNSKERLAAYEKMQDAVRKEYESIIGQMERLKVEGKVKSATYRQLMGRKMNYENIMNLYKLYNLF